MALSVNNLTSASSAHLCFVDCGTALLYFTQVDDIPLVDVLIHVGRRLGF